MIIYLVSRQHEWKISEMKAYSNLESIIKERINSNYWKYFDKKPRIHKCDIDSGNVTSILSIKEWRQALIEFKEKYPNEIAKLELLK